MRSVLTLARLFYFALLLLGIANVDAAAETADQVLIQVVNQFDKASGNIYSKHKYLALRTGRGPFGSQYVERRGDAENFRILDSDHVARGAEYRRTGEAIPDWGLKEERVDWLRPKVGLETRLAGHCAFQHDASYIGKRWNDDERIGNVYFIPTAQRSIGQSRGCDLEDCRIVVGLVVGDLSRHGCGWVRRCLPISEYENLNVGSVLPKPRFFRGDNVVGGHDESIGGRNESGAAEDVVLHRFVQPSHS